MKRFLSGGTDCPKCGRTACSVSGRLFRRSCHCPFCGAPCGTPTWVYAAAVAVSAAGGLCYIAATVGPDWRTDGEWLFSCFWVVCLVYIGAGSLLMGLVPLRHRAELGWKAAEAPLEHFFSYDAQDVYHAANNALRRADSYEVTERDPEQKTLWASKSGNALTRARWQAHEQSLFLSLLAEPLEDGSCRLALNVVPKIGGLEQWERKRELERVVRLIQQELERFSYQTAEQKKRT